MNEWVNEYLFNLSSYEVTFIMRIKVSTNEGIMSPFYGPNTGSNSVGGRIMKKTKAQNY